MATALEITSLAPPADVAKLVATAERMCYVMDAINRPHEISRRVVLNGQPLV